MMSYLRSVLQNNYLEADSDYIMVSTPRVINYELLVIEYALDLMESFGKQFLLKRTSLEEDLARY